MKRSRKSNRVSWASSFNLCQVKLFLSEESPCKVGMNYQDHLHAKPSHMLHSNIAESNDLPPGFENNHHMNTAVEHYHIPQIQWKCPPKFVMDRNWFVVAGEESEEVVVQKRREMRVLEAVYPRVSAIPPCPAVSLGVEERYDDSLTPVIPITPIEEEEFVEMPSTLSSTLSKHETLPALGTSEIAKPVLPVSEYPAKDKPALGMPLPDLITTAALTATMKSDKIDTQLLLKIFSDPKIMESLTKDYGAAKGNTVSAPTSVSGLNMKQANHSVSPRPDIMVQQQNASRMEPNFAASPPKLTTASAPVNHLFGSNPLQNKGNLTMPANRMNPNPSIPTGMIPNPPNPSLRTVKPYAIVSASSSARDADYYKNLIKQHGGDHQERLQGGLQFQMDNYGNNQFQNTQNPNVMMNQKPCAYFNGPKGCRKGANCNFKHEISLQRRDGPITMMEAPNAKRMRLGGELIGRT